MPNVSIPDATYRRLAARAAEQNTTVDDLAASLLSADGAARAAADRLLDSDYHAECAADPTPVPSLEEVRAVTAKLPGSLAAELIAGRDDR